MSTELKYRSTELNRSSAVSSTMFLYAEKWFLWIRGPFNTSPVTSGTAQSVDSSLCSLALKGAVVCFRSPVISLVCLLVSYQQYHLSVVDWSNTPMTTSMSAGKMVSSAAEWGFFNNPNNHRVGCVGNTQHSSHMRPLKPPPPCSDSVWTSAGCLWHGGAALWLAD